MVVVSGIEIPNQKKLMASLRYIRGIGKFRSLVICQKAGIDPDIRTSVLTEEEISRLVLVINNEKYLIEGDLRRFVANNIKRLMDIGSNRGIRHRKGLTVRGQKTHSNARTRKKMSFFMVAGKKK